MSEINKLSVGKLLDKLRSAKRDVMAKKICSAKAVRSIGTRRALFAL